MKRSPRPESLFAGLLGSMRSVAIWSAALTFLAFVGQHFYCSGLVALTPPPTESPSSTTTVRKKVHTVLTSLAHRRWRKHVRHTKPRPRPDVITFASHPRAPNRARRR